jgi:hypothetical protein
VPYRRFPRFAFLHANGRRHLHTSNSNQLQNARSHGVSVSASPAMIIGNSAPVDRLVEFAPDDSRPCQQLHHFLSPTLSYNERWYPRRYKLRHNTMSEQATTLKEQPGGAEVPAVVHDLLRSRATLTPQFVVFMVRWGVAGG